MTHQIRFAEQNSQYFAFGFTQSLARQCLYAVNDSGATVGGVCAAAMGAKKEAKQVASKTAPAPAAGSAVTDTITVANGQKVDIWYPAGRSCT